VSPVNFNPDKLTRMKVAEELEEERLQRTAFANLPDAE
jgi:hypothetical protein